MQQITPLALQQRLTTEGSTAPLLLDVREPWEFEICHIDGSLSMPMTCVPLRLEELDPARETVVICHHGIRSASIANFLAHRGFTAVINLSGGIDAWSLEADLNTPRY